MESELDITKDYRDGRIALTRTSARDTGTITTAAPPSASERERRRNNDGRMCALILLYEAADPLRTTFAVPSEYTFCVTLYRLVSTVALARRASRNNMRATHAACDTHNKQTLNLWNIRKFTIFFFFIGNSGFSSSKYEKKHIDQ